MKNDVPYINFNDIYNEVGFDYSTDLGDSSHCNYNGAKKVTNYLADYINTNYDLEDRRDDPDYNLWELDLEYWRQYDENLET